MADSTASWIQNALLLINAGLVWRYVFETTAIREAAQRQAEASENQLAILRAQIKEHTEAEHATLRECVDDLEQAAQHWVPRIEKWGQLTPQENVDILPPNWGVALESARKSSPDLYRRLRALQQHAMNASRRIQEFSGKVQNQRDEKEANEIKHLLLIGVMSGCLHAKGLIK